MPRLKEAEELNIKELEGAESGGRPRYNGPIPDSGTMLRFRVTKMWWTYSSNEDEMLKVLCVAEDNPGDLEEYDGLPAWENLVLTPGGKFKWEPFLEHFGLAIRDVSKKLYVSEDDDNQGAPIEKIAGFHPGSDDALFVGVISKEKFGGKWQAHIAEWLDADTELEDAEEEEEEKPARRSRAASPATGRGRKQRDEPEDEEPEDEPEEEEEARPARSRRKPAAKPAARGRGTKRAAKKDDDEPPF